MATGLHLVAGLPLHVPEEQQEPRRLELQTSFVLPFADDLARALPRFLVHGVPGLLLDAFQLLSPGIVIFIVLFGFCFPVIVLAGLGRPRGFFFRGSAGRPASEGGGEH